jgi:hypothetical protein
MKKMKVRNLVKVMCAACLLIFCSCDKRLAIEIPLSSITIEMDDISVGNNSGLKSTLSTFNETQTILLSNLQGVSEEALKYRTKIESVKVGSTSTITIIATDNAGTVVEEFVLSADGTDNFSIDRYNLGTPHSDNVQDFAAKFLLKLLLNGEITLNASGKTDIPSGENLKVKLTLKDITLVTNVLAD